MGTAFESRARRMMVAALRRVKRGPPKRAPCWPARTAPAPWRRRSMLALILSDAAPDSENQVRFCSRRWSARALRWVGSCWGMLLAQEVDQGVEAKNGARGSWLDV